MSPSPWSHIYRLILVLVVGVGSFLLVKNLAVPESWDAQAWYRKDALADLQQQQPRFGGNESCYHSACHEKDPKIGDAHKAKFQQKDQSVHKGLACEACHDALSNHVQQGEKIHDSYFKIDRNSALCLTCHRSLTARKDKIVQFSEDFEIHKMMGVTEAKSCIGCHNPHAPK